MKTNITRGLGLLALTLSLPTLAQGPLTPPGAPAPTMKTLDQIEPRMPISSLPYTISNSGSYYLTGILTGQAATNGITIVANDVTLDLHGFALVGVTGSLSGIVVSGSRTNVAVRNGSIRSWGSQGVDGGSIRAGRFDHLLVSTNGSTGLEAGTACVINECVAYANGGYGISVADGCVVVHCTASGNRLSGFYGSWSRFEGCTANFNQASGFYVFQYSQIRDCLAIQNEDDGIVLGRGCHAVGNSCSLNNSAGTTAYGGIRTFYEDGYIEGNYVHYTAGKGIYVRTNSLDPSIGWTVVRNRTSGPTATAYIYTAGNDVGPIGTAAASTSPWANLRY